MSHEAPKAYCADCGTYVGRRWGVLRQTVYYCSSCLRKHFPSQEVNESRNQEIPY